MTKEQKKEFDNLYKFDNQEDKTINIEQQKKINKKKVKEREKRIKQKKAEEKSQFDFDTETVIGMTNKNNKNKQQNTQRRVTKKQAKIERKNKKIKKNMKWISLFLVIIGGGIFTLVSPIFNIKEIQVSNNNQIATETIVSISQLQLGQNLFRFNKNQVEKKIKTNPYVETVNIKRKIPNKIEIQIKERDKNYNVEFLNGYAYINNQGYILEISEQKLDLPVIIGISTKQEQVVEGNRLDEEDLGKLEVVIQIMNICKDYDLNKKVSAIDITNKNDYVIYMEEEKKTIHLGDESNLSNKMLYVQAIIKENEGKEGYIYLNGDINNNFKPRFREKV